MDMIAREGGRKLRIIHTSRLRKTPHDPLQTYAQRSCSRGHAHTTLDWDKRDDQFIQKSVRFSACEYGGPFSSSERDLPKPFVAQASELFEGVYSAV